jgi:hypothetical protein
MITSLNNRIHVGVFISKLITGESTRVKNGKLAKEKTRPLK